MTSLVKLIILVCVCITFGPRGVKAVCDADTEITTMTIALCTPLICAPPTINGRIDNFTQIPGFGLPGCTITATAAGILSTTDVLCVGLLTVCTEIPMTTTTTSAPDSSSSVDSSNSDSR